MVVFPAPVAPTMPMRSPWFDHERDVAQDEVLAVVREPDVVEDDSRSGALRTRCIGGCCRPAAHVGELIATGVSSSWKIRSDEAIAPCRMLNFSERS